MHCNETLWPSLQRLALPSGLPFNVWPSLQRLALPSGPSLALRLHLRLVEVSVRLQALGRQVVLVDGAADDHAQPGYRANSRGYRANSASPSSRVWSGYGFAVLAVLVPPNPRRPACAVPSWRSARRDGGSWCRVEAWGVGLSKTALQETWPFHRLASLGAHFGVTAVTCYMIQLACSIPSRVCFQVGDLRRPI